jgi:hypothetical protein
LVLATAPLPKACPAWQMGGLGTQSLEEGSQRSAWAQFSSWLQPSSQGGTSCVESSRVTKNAW